MGEFKELTALLFRLQERSKNSYLSYFDRCKKDECLGAEIKIRQGAFGYRELSAHTAAAEHFGSHLAYCEAASMIAEVLREMDEIGPTQEVKPIKTDFDSRPMPEKWEVGMRVRAPAGALAWVSALAESSESSGALAWIASRASVKEIPHSTQKEMFVRMCNGTAPWQIKE